MKAWNEPLGLCRFEDLPPVYQDWFAHGAEPTHLSAPRMFVPEKHPWVSAALTPIWLLLSSTPWIAILDSTSAPRDAIALSVLAAALLPPLWVVLRSVRAVAGVVAIRDAARRGAALYGLAVDDQALVLRLFQPFAWTLKTCLYVPRSQITGYAKSSEFDEAAGNNRSSTLRVLFRDHNGKIQSARIASRSTLAVGPFPLEKKLIAWEQGLTGIWRRSALGHADVSNDVILEFSPDGSGALVDLLDGEALTRYPFHWTLNHWRQVQLEPASEHAGLPIKLAPWLTANPIQSRGYDLEITIDSANGEPIYVLRLLQPLAGMTLGSLGQPASDAHREVKSVG